MISGRGPRIFLLAACAAALTGPAAFAETAPSMADLGQLSIDQLASLSVTSASKQPEPLGTAAAAIYVITADEIQRSGATTLPEILRLAPNLQVIRISSSRYIITARGFSGNIGDQNFSNKLLVLIDGRIVYSPMYSGVYWNMQDVASTNIERIEIISGPRATLWGANAMNGVINIVTRPAADTQGGVLDLSLGTLDSDATLQYGGKLSDTLDYRVYVRDHIGQNTETPSGKDAHDDWSRLQGGFRLNWTPSPRDTVMFKGNTYDGTIGSTGPDENIRGSNLQTQWAHDLGNGSSFQVLAYYDRAERATEMHNGQFSVDTYDLEVQHNFALNDWNTIVWGAGVRASNYRVHGTAHLFFQPDSGTLLFTDVFVQDNVTLSDSVSAVLGVKIEDDAYQDPTPLFDVRVSWQPVSEMMFWAAFSTSIRSPTPFDVDVVEKVDPILLTGWQDFTSEKLTAYQIGTRMQPSERLSFSVSAFYNVYDDLRSLELTDLTFTHFRWGNGLRGRTWGVEAWGNYQVADWWRLSAGITELIGRFHFAPSSIGLLGTAQLGDDPERTADLRSSMNLGHDVTFDADLRYVGHRPDPHVPSFVELNASLGWLLTERLRLSLSGFNLLHARHQEFPPSEANAIPRSYSVGLQWRF